MLKSGDVQIESWVKLDANGAPRKLNLQLNANGSATLTGTAASTTVQATQSASAASTNALLKLTFRR
ncbi:hypothetical protein VN23_14765 [Janthinobacterium sp. B9-8]|nr:hypothetical protein VN23_14765 [Janthinobacterium sp. B9-8]